MIKVTLNILTLNSVLTALRNVMELSHFGRYKIHEGKEIFLRNELRAKVSRHHLIGSKLFSKKKPMIFVTFNGSSAMVFYEGDKFEWTTNSEIKIKTPSGGMKIVKIKSMTKKEQQRLEYERKNNEEYSSQYWNDVAKEMDEQYENDMMRLLGDDF